MAYTILTESYGRRLPKITAEADSTDDLATLGTDWAEGSTCEIGDTTYSLDKVKGWIDPSSGGGGGGSVLIVEVTEVEERWICNKTWQEIYDAFMSGVVRLNFPVSKENAAKIGTVIGIDVEYAYGIIYTFGTSSDQMSATTANDYPSISFD